MEALALITVFPENRDQLKTYHQTVKAEIINHKAPLKVRAKLAYLKTVIDNILEDKEIKESFLKEYLLYGKEKVITIDGVEMSEMEAGVKYFYKDSGDPTWNDLNKEIEELTKKRKEREAFLRSLPYEGTVDPKTGLYITPPPKQSTTVVSCKIK